MLKKLVAVVGATGNQGGSVVQSLLKDGSYAVRGIVRNTDSDKAKALVARGVEIVKADGTFCERSRERPWLSSATTASNVNELKGAFTGADAVFGMTTTDFVDGSAKYAYNQLKNIADAAQHVGAFLVMRCEQRSAAFGSYLGVQHL